MAIVDAGTVVVLADVRAYHPGSIAAAPLGLGVVVGVAVLWAGLDGWLRRPVEAGTWFAAGLLAGPLAGLLSVAAQALLVDATGTEALGTALTGGAAFLALLVAGPAVLGRALGHMLRSQSAVGVRDQRRGEVRYGPRP